MVITSTTKVANLNVEQVDGADLETTWSDSDVKIVSSKGMKTKADSLIAAHAGTNTHAQLDVLLKGINMRMFGIAGFVEGAYYGSNQNVLHSDDNAYVQASGFIPKAGSYKIAIWSRSSDAARTDNGDLYWKQIVDGTTIGGGWDANEAKNLVHTNADTWYLTQSSAITISADNTLFTCSWGKSNNPGTGTLYIYLIVLIRQ